MTTSSEGTLETLDDDGETRLTRARADGASVLLRAPCTDFLSPRAAARLRREFRMAPHLDPAWALRPLRLEEGPAGPVLVLDGFAGRPLSRETGTPMPLERFFPLAVQMAGAVEGMHRGNLVHKDLRPGNVLVGEGVRLTGFGRASLLPREQPAEGRPEVLEGALAYMSPEQTGRMNRTVDRRTDLYSLGITFYEMLTGRLPFQGRDSLEWVHCHVARLPMPPRDLVPSIPAVLSDVVMKLLAKAAEERYQTAAGLRADLERCQGLPEGERFPLGEQDVPDRLPIPQRLYGREAELAALAEALGRVASRGRPEVFLLRGPAGVGKSSVVHEFHRAEPSCEFLSGKFGLQERDVPYSTVVQAFRERVRGLLAESEETLARWRQRLQAALSPNGALVVQVIPLLERILGPQPTVVPMPPADAEVRFRTTFRRFLSVFATAEQPLVLFLDDLHWADPASLDLVRDLAACPEPLHLLLVGAWRDAEESEALSAALEGLRRTAALQETDLAPLGEEDLLHLVAEAVGRPAAETRPLARVLHERTEGNPFFAIQLLLALAEQGHLCYDRGWVWDLEGISRAGGSGVVDLVVARLGRLPAGTGAILQDAACLGDRVDLDLLAAVAGTGPEEVEARLGPAVAEGMMLRQGEAVRFTHDRVRQAALATVADPEARHLALGRRLLERLPAEEVEERVFDLASQFMLGAGLLEDPRERLQVARLHRVAGRKARAATAYRSAAAYFEAGVALLPEGWDALASSLHLGAAECRWLTGDFERADRLLQVLDLECRDPLERAAAGLVEIQLLTTRGQGAGAVAAGLRHLEALGISLVVHPSAEEVQAEYAATWEALGETPIEALQDLPEMEDPRVRAAMEVLSILSAPALFTDNNLYVQLHCRMVTLSLRHGNTGASAVAYVVFGMILGSAFGRYAEGTRFGRLACVLAERPDSLGYKATVLMTYASMVHPWTEPVREALPWIESAFRAGTATGDLTRACYCCAQSANLKLFAGDPLDEVEAWLDRQIEFVEQARYGLILDVLEAQRAMVRSLRGVAPDPSLEEALAARVAEPGMPLRACRYHLARLQARVVAGDFAAAAVEGERMEAFLPGSFAQVEGPEHAFYQSLALAWGRRQGARRRLETHRRLLEAWARHCPANFRSRHLLVSAECARRSGRRSLGLYEEALRAAREDGFPQVEALAGEAAARHCQEHGLDHAARAYLAAARRAWLRWGAEGRVREMERTWPWLAAPDPRALPPTHLDALAVVRASQAISREILLDRLLEALMTTILEHAGADRAVLVLRRDGALRVEAEIGADLRVRLPRLAAEESPDLPRTVLHYVVRAREPVLLDDVAADPTFSGDPGLSRTRSVLCLPVVLKGDLLGALYLENHLAAGAFTPDRVAILELLAAQAAISLENALLFEARQEAEAELRRLNVDLEGRVGERTARLEEANRELEAFTWSVSHDLRGPLHLLTGFGRLLQDGPGAAMGLDGRDLLDRMLHLAGRMQQLTEALLRLSRIGRQELRWEGVDLAGLARAAAQDRPAEDRDVDVEVEEGLATVGDPGLLRVLMDNLLSNAFKFTRGRPDRRVEVGLAEGAFLVRDNGVGFDPAQVHRLFEPFQRLHSEAAYEGTGIGLATARRIVQRHGGRIWAETAPGGGASFRFVLGPPVG